MAVYHFIYLLTGLVLGGLISWFIAKASFASTVNTQGDQLKAKEQEILLSAKEKEENRLNNNLTTLNQELKTEREKSRKQIVIYTRLEAEYKNLQKSLKTQNDELRQIREKFSIEFKNLANEIFEEKSKKFTDATITYRPRRESLST